MTATETPSRAAHVPAGAPLLVRLAGWSRRHHWTAIVVWVLVLASTVGAAGAVGDAYRNDFSLPGSESQRLTSLLAEHQPDQQGDTVTVVVKAEGGVETRAGRESVDTLVAALEELSHVAAVQPPRAGEGSVSPDGTLGLVTVVLDGATGDVPREAKEQLLDTALSFDGSAGAGELRVEATGDAVREVEEEAGGAAEGAGVTAALVILLFLFGSLLAASLPIITAIFAVGTTVGVITLLSHLTTIPDYTPPVLMLVGLGVGIDYALLIFARYRSELVAGADRERAATTALETAGRSVLFAGATVVIALLGLLTLGLPSLQGLALSVTLTVLMTMLASLTLLPCLLTIFGSRLERSIRKRAARAATRGREPGRRWRTWAGFVQRRPILPLVSAVTLLGALSLPALSMHLGLADAGNDHPSQTSRQAYDLITEGFGSGANGPLVVVTQGAPDDATAATATLEADPGISAVTAPQASPDGSIATSLAFPTTSPQDERTAELVERLREDVPGGTLIGGATASTVDFADAVADRFPIFVAVVVGLSVLLLLLVFRSVPIALKAGVLNLLSIGASLGVITLVFDQGWFGVQPGPVEAFVPVMIFAIVFGLSMDYEVFLLSRMHEEWRRTGDAVIAVREGLAMTGGVITAAAAIMIVVFGAFMFSSDRMLQQFGLGLGTAVLLDAVVIRCLVVPAVMGILGQHAWWAPRWLDRLVPTLRVD